MKMNKRFKRVTKRHYPLPYPIHKEGPKLRAREALEGEDRGWRRVRILTAIIVGATGLILFFLYFYYYPRSRLVYLPERPSYEQSLEALYPQSIILHTKGASPK